MKQMTELAQQREWLRQGLNVKWGARQIWGKWGSWPINGT